MNPPFVPISANMFVNLDHVVTMQVGQAKALADSEESEPVVILNTDDKHAVIVRGVFAVFVLKTIGAEAHIPPLVGPNN